MARPTITQEAGDDRSVVGDTLPTTAEVRPADYREGLRRSNLIIGVDRTGAAMEFDLFARPGPAHTLVVAPAGAGATVFLRGQIVQALNQNAQVLVLDTRRTAHHWATVHPSVTHVSEIATIHDELLAIRSDLNQRLATDLTHGRRPIHLAAAVNGSSIVGDRVLGSAWENFDIRVVASSAQRETWTRIAPEVDPPEPIRAPGLWHLVVDGERTQVKALHWTADDARNACAPDVAR